MFNKTLFSLLLSILCTSAIAMMKVDDEETEVEASLVEVGAKSYPQAHFNREIVTALETLFDNEQKGVYAAYYECEHAGLLEKWKTVARKKKLAGALLLSRNSKAEAAEEKLSKSGVQLYQVTKPRKHWGKYKDQRATKVNYEDMHHKILVFEQNLGDKPVVVFGSFNLTETAAKYHSENIVILDDPNAIAYFVEELNTLYKYASPLREVGESVFPLKIGHKDPRLKLALPRAVFSPDIREVTKKLISDEQEYISGAQFRFTLYDVAVAWAKAKIQGELMLDSHYAEDFVEALTHLKEHGVSLYWITKKFFPGATQYALVHHKFLIFRKNVGDKKLLMVGSFNMTGQASENNWENVVIIDDAPVIKKFEQELEVLRKDAQAITTKSLVYKGKETKSAFTKKMNGL